MQSTKRSTTFDWRAWLPVLLIVVAGLAVYHNSFRGAFVFDDELRIRNNPRIRQLWPLSDTTRPLVQLSLAINYRLGGLNVWGYHAFNLAIHILAAMVLYSVVRRTLARRGDAETSRWLALAVAVVWMVHPLQTQSVTYVIQRSEAMMGLFYLLTLYCFIRGVESSRWYWAAVAACALGMISKPVMVTAPIIVLLYDRAFVSKRFREALRSHAGLYAGLAATWGLLAAVLENAAGEWQPTAGFGGETLKPFEYALTQLGVVVHYLKLACWPARLCLDYDWPVARTAGAVLLPAVVISVLVAATLWAWRGRPEWGFFGAWFFLILMPTSSFIPVADVAFEHRMYLPLAAVVAVVAFGTGAMIGSLRMTIALALVVTAALGYRTVLRNRDYLSETAIWRSAVEQYPSNARARNNLGEALSRSRQPQQAIEQYRAALKLKPEYADAYNNLGVELEGLGQTTEAILHLSEAVRLRPTEPIWQQNLGLAFGRAGQLDKAIEHFAEATRLKPSYAEAYYNWGLALTMLRRTQEAIQKFQETIRIRPSYAEAHYDLGYALQSLGRLADAATEYQEALRYRPDYPAAQKNLAALQKQKK